MAHKARGEREKAKSGNSCQSGRTSHSKAPTYTMRSSVATSKIVPAAMTGAKPLRLGIKLRLRQAGSRIGLDVEGVGYER